MAKKKKTETTQREFTRRELSSFKKEKKRQRILFFGGIGIIAAIVLIILAGWFISEYQPLHRVVLTVGDEDVNMAYYIDVLNLSRANNPDEEINTIASNVLEQIKQGELLRVGAEKLGITVTDDEVKKLLEENGMEASHGYMRYIGNQMLVNKILTEYYEKNIPQSGVQVHPLITMLESDKKAQEVRERYLSGDNFTALAKEFGQDYYSKMVNSGDFDWHPKEILKTLLSSQIPLDYAFGAELGSLSDPLTDNETYKQLGYWLLRVNERPEQGSANVSAVLLSDEALALNIKTRLEAGENLGPIADELSNYSPSKDRHGELGIITKPQEADETAITASFDEYVFSENTTLGNWSSPISDNVLWTQGGSWLVKVLERDENREFTKEDRDAIIQQTFNEWFTDLTENPGVTVEEKFFSEEMRAWAIDRALKELPTVQG